MSVGSLKTVFVVLLSSFSSLALPTPERSRHLLDLLDPSILNRINTIHKQPCICIPLIECPPLYALISHYPIHSERIEFLKNQTCGFRGKEPLVCCLDLQVPTNQVLAKLSESSNVPLSRIERCLASSEEEKIDSKPQHSSYYHSRFFPSRSSQHKPMRHWFSPNQLLPGTKGVPENEMDDETATTVSGPIIDRKKLLPDKTCGMSLDQRIVGGKKAKLGAYPWIARLGYTRSSSPVYLYRCGGTLINSRFVLTAAHCIDGLPIDFKLATIRLGEQDERTDPDCEGDVCADPPQDFKPIVIMAHRNYNVPKFKNDIGLIRLDRDAVITQYVSPICLPFKSMQSTDYSGMDAIAAGWGTVNVETSSSSPVLQDVSLKIGKLEDCISTYASRFQMNVGTEQLCTMGQEGRDTCEGDSGGPLMRFEQLEKNGVPRYYLVGIVSYGAKRCGTADIPAVFTRVSSHLDWILFHIDDDYALIT